MARRDPHTLDLFEAPQGFYPVRRVDVPRGLSFGGRLKRAISASLTGWYEYLELNRMWLDDVAPRNSESRALSYAMKYLKRACPHVKWVQSFADERCGCLGVVYQAANFLYIGSHLTKFYELDGEAYHPMLLTAHKRPSNRGRMLAENLDRATARSLRQYRYIYFIKPQFKRDLRVVPKPYPKP